MTALRYDFGPAGSRLKDGFERITCNHEMVSGENLMGTSHDHLWGDHTCDYVSGDPIFITLRLEPSQKYVMRIGAGDPVTRRHQKIYANGQSFVLVADHRLEWKEFEVQTDRNGLVIIELRSAFLDQPALINFLVVKAVVEETPAEPPDVTFADNWLAAFPSFQAPSFVQLPSEILSYQPGTTWLDLDEKQVFQWRVSSDQPVYEYRIGKGSQIYSLRFMNKEVWNEVIPTQRPESLGLARTAEWVDEVLQTIMVNRELNDPTSEPTKYQIHQAGTYAPTRYSPILASYWSPLDRALYTWCWPQQAHIPSNFNSHMLLGQKIRDLGSGVIEMTYLYYNFSRSEEIIDYLASPFFPMRTSVLPYPFLSRDDKWAYLPRTWPDGGADLISETDGFFAMGDGPTDIAVGIVFGTDTNYRGQHRPTRFRWGKVDHPKRDLTITSLQKYVNIRPGETFYHRFYLIINRLPAIRTLAQIMLPGVHQDYLSDNGIVSCQ